MITITQTKTALAPGLTASFLGSGGVSPYIYTVQSGSRGTIDAATGLYTAPLSTLNDDPKQSTDTIRVTGDDGDFSTSTILVGSAFILFCDIVQQGMGLAPGRVYMFDQKIMQPTDSGLYIAVSEVSCKPFGNNIGPLNDDWSNSFQTLNMMSTLDIDLMSRGPEARTRKGEFLMALNSQYSRTQQTGNSFNIGKLPANGKFLNLSLVDGAAIPYRYKISINIQYTEFQSRGVDYYNQISNTVATDP